MPRQRRNAQHNIWGHKWWLCKAQYDLWESWCRFNYKRWISMGPHTVRPVFQSDFDTRERLQRVPEFDKLLHRLALVCLRQVQRICVVSQHYRYGLLIRQVHLPGQMFQSTRQPPHSWDIARWVRVLIATCSLHLPRIYRGFQCLYSSDNRASRL